MNKRINKYIFIFNTVLFFLPFYILNAGQYDHVDEHVLNLKNLNEKDILQLTYHLTKPFNKKDEKIRAVYRWITDNIEYDTSILNNKGKRAKTFQDVLDKRKCVCNGYAILFKAMMNKISIECEIIYGYSKGYNYEIGNLFNENNMHAWNAVKINQKWHLIDATWGAGYIDDNRFVRSFNDYYFFTPPEEMIKTHYPKERKWQLLTKKIYKDDFENSVYLKSSFFKYNLKINSHADYVIKVDNSTQIDLIAPIDILIEANIIYNENNLDKRYVFTQRKNDLVEISAVFPFSEEYILRLFARKKSETGPFNWILDYKVKTNKDNNELVGFPEKYEAFDEYRTYVYSPLLKFLAQDNEVFFKLEVNDCDRVAMIHNEKFIFFNKNDNIFEQNIVIPKGKFFITASKPESNQFNYLLEYDGWK
jgi:hypothetical protein